MNITIFTLLFCFFFCDFISSYISVVSFSPFFLILHLVLFDFWNILWIFYISYPVNFFPFIFFSCVAFFFYWFERKVLPLQAQRFILIHTYFLGQVSSMLSKKCSEMYVDKEAKWQLSLGLYAMSMCGLFHEFPNASIWDRAQCSLLLMNFLGAHVFSFLFLF